MLFQLWLYISANEIWELMRKSSLSDPKKLFSEYILIYAWFYICLFIVLLYISLCFCKLNNIHLNLSLQKMHFSVIIQVSSFTLLSPFQPLAFNSLYLSPLLTHSKCGEWTLAVESGALLKDYRNVEDRPAARLPSCSNLVFRGWLGGIDDLIRELQPRCSSSWLTKWGQWPIKGSSPKPEQFISCWPNTSARHRHKVFTMGEQLRMGRQSSEPQAVQL